MNNTIKNWYFDVTNDTTADFEAFGNMLRVFVNFIKSPATSMGIGKFDNLAIVGNIAGKGRIMISEVTLISKVDKQGNFINSGTNTDTITRIETAAPYAYQVITTSGITYHLLDSDMDIRFRKEFIFNQKVVHINFAASF